MYTKWDSESMESEQVKEGGSGVRKRMSIKTINLNILGIILF